jgi:aspartate/methionine/tyrosine aminotransferase
VVNGPAELLNSALARLEFIADTYLSVAAPLAHALPTLLAGRSDIQKQISRRVHENLCWLDQQLSAESLVQRLNSAGGWYAVLKLPTTRTDEDWALALLEQHNVLVHPGHFFDFHSDGYLVVSLLTAPGTFQQGISNLLALIR